MPQARPMSVSRRNLVWFAIIVIAAAVGWFVGGWQVAVGAAVLALIVSEVVERLARRKRRHLAATGGDGR